MNEQVTRLGWTDRATFIGLSLTIIGFTWILHTEHREDARRSDERWHQLNNKYEERWADLLSKFYELDKKVK